MSFLRSILGTKAPRFVEIEPLGARFEVPPGKTILKLPWQAASRFRTIARSAPAVHASPDCCRDAWIH